MTKETEYWDLYERSGKPLGRRIRRGERMQEGEYHLVVHIAIFHPDGRMLIQKRTANKESWASYWDFGVGGSAICQDTSQETAHRETLEEIGLDYDFQDHPPIARFYGTHSLTDVYLIECALDTTSLILQKEEVSEVRWASVDEILSMIQEGSFIAYQPSLLRLLQEMHRHPGIHVRKEQDVFSFK